MEPQTSAQTYADCLKSKISQGKQDKPESKKARLERIFNEGTSLTRRQIAKSVGCCKVYVSQMKRANMMGEKPPWYETHVSNAQDFDSSIPAFDQPIAYTTNLSSHVSLRNFTEEELDEHVMDCHGKLNAETARLRRGLFHEARKGSFHGFVQVNQAMSEDDNKAFDTILHEKLPALLTSTKHGAAAAYGACFTPIFQYAQLAPLGPGEERGNEEKELERRMGDQKRSQAKLSTLLETAKMRVEQAQANVDTCRYKTGKQKQNLDKILTLVKGEEALLLDLLHYMRKHCKCIGKVRCSRIRFSELDH